MLIIVHRLLDIEQVVTSGELQHMHIMQVPLDRRPAEEVHLIVQRYDDVAMPRSRHASCQRGLRPHHWVCSRVQHVRILQEAVLASAVRVAAMEQHIPAPHQHRCMPLSSGRRVAHRVHRVPSVVILPAQVDPPHVRHLLRCVSVRVVRVIRVKRPRRATNNEHLRPVEEGRAMRLARVRQRLFCVHRYRCPAHVVQVEGEKVILVPVAGAALPTRLKPPAAKDEHARPPVRSGAAH
mmetsp:Transcript_52613/g.118117  ORF Transcript_52613/g.118117 Transcript_52613/m.118117 type:complete len:237 (+) Transcript_52613:318-1028(+)